MISHMFKLIWSRKRNNFLLITEMTFSFAILFIVISLLTSSINKYLVPIGFEYHNIIEFYIHGKDSINAFEVKRQLEMMPEVAGVAFSSFADPYEGSDASGGLKYKNRILDNVHWYDVDNDYEKVLNIKLSEGRWFNSSDDGSAVEPVVINGKLKNELFSAQSAINKTFEGRRKTYKVIGVVAHYKKDGEFSDENYVEFMRFSRKNIGPRGCSFLIKTKYRTTAAFETKLIKFANSVSPVCSKTLRYMKNKREQFIAPVVKQLILFSTLGAFLIINVALGLYGILWYNISRRKQEIGLRRALGAGRINIYRQITGEILFLASISIIIGGFLLVQFPLIDLLKVKPGVYFFSLGFSALLIFVLVLICALYPGILASRIEPAEALHGE